MTATCTSAVGQANQGPAASVFRSFLAAVDDREDRTGGGA